MPGPAPPAASEPCAPCGSFALDLAAEIGHTTCRRCGFPKRAHGPPATLQSPELRRKLSKRESINGAVRAARRRRPPRAAPRRRRARRGAAALPQLPPRPERAELRLVRLRLGPGRPRRQGARRARASSELRDALRGTSRRSFDEANDCFVSVKIPADAPAHGDDSDDDDAEAAFFCGGPAAGSFACSGFSFLS
ncbi:hypothetical protein SO694_00015252 [Aureococcus anophagefferens]|uniref:GATA-type domain-containing protein n=1 Tax=Aureococcus anophagefferens TaxID=44056 RepID=A0ABR1G3A4_AURAN